MLAVGQSRSVLTVSKRMDGGVSKERKDVQEVLSSEEWGMYRGTLGTRKSWIARLLSLPCQEAVPVDLPWGPPRCTIEKILFHHFLDHGFLAPDWQLQNLHKLFFTLTHHVDVLTECAQKARDCMSRSHTISMPACSVLSTLHVPYSAVLHLKTSSRP